MKIDFLTVQSFKKNFNHNGIVHWVLLNIPLFSVKFNTSQRIQQKWIRPTSFKVKVLKTFTSLKDGIFKMRKWYQCYLQVQPPSQYLSPFPSRKCKIGFQLVPPWHLVIINYFLKVYRSKILIFWITLFDFRSSLVSLTGHYNITIFLKIPFF